MFIKYNRPNNHVLSTFGDIHPNGVMKMPDTFILRPGWNEFPKSVWDLHVNDEEIKRLIKEGSIELSDVKVSLKDGKKTVTKTLSQIDSEVHLTAIKEEAKCIEIIKGTFNREMLQRWLDEETRHKVKRAIDKQLEPLLNPKTESA